MNFSSFRRTSVSSILERPQRTNGSALIVTAFLFLAFGTLALGIIFLSRVYLKIGGYEKHSRLLDYGTENGIKEGFHHLVAAVANAPLPAIIDDERYAELRADALSSGRLLAEEVTGLRFPVELRAQEERMIWRSHTNFQLKATVDQETFILARFALPIQAEGRLSGFDFIRPSSLDVNVDVLAGRVPLSTIPFLLNKDIPEGARVDFAEGNGITFAPSFREILPPQISFAEEPLIPQDATPLIGEALDIEIFRPQDISSARLRSALGLEESQEPVPDGVYLIRTDLGLGGIYVQGDVEEIVAAIEGTFQVISFRLESGSWVLKFSPSQSQTIFRSPAGDEMFDLVPLGIIIVDGKVMSFGGGRVDEQGNIRLITDQEIPSLLSGISLTLVASEEIVIASHLLQQGITWQDGIPYIKSEQTQLVIFSTGRDLWRDEAREGGIVISGDAPQDLKVQADLAAGGEGIQAEGADKTLRLLGSIQTAEYVFSGRRLLLTPRLPRISKDGHPPSGPQTIRPVLFISRFSAAAWKEY